MNKFWIYDIETYKNYFGVIFKNPKTSEIQEFIIFKDRNDLDQLINFVYGFSDRYFIGYNNFNFDNKILTFIHKKFTTIEYIFGELVYTTDEICKLIYDFAVSIINNEAPELYAEFKSIDLMKAGNTGNKSLKLVAVNLKWPIIQDLPINWNKEITKNDLEILHKYNLNDVEITEELYNRLIPQLKLRGEISKLYDVNVLSESKSGIANRLLEKIYSKLIGVKPSEFRGLRTHRDIIHFRNVVFDNVNFKTKILQNLLNELKQHTYYKNQKFFRKSVIFYGVKYQLGIGGLHSDDKGEIFESDKDNYLIDCDIASMYPTIMINNRLCPAHLDDKLVDEYKDIRDRRLKAKKTKPVEADTLKIVLNSIFGKTLFEHHWLYDPLVGLKITINGQLYLLMLIENLVLDGFTVISANTDGLITIVPKNRLHEYISICKQWCSYTNFELEYTYYKQYIRKDVNNYLVIKEDGTVKDKGAFIVESDDLMKGFDKPIISIALREYFLYGIPITDTILNHKDIYDFCTAKKTDSKFTTELHYVENGQPKIDTLQKTNRYYVSTNGGTLYKVDKKENNYINYCLNRKVTIFNNYIQLDDYKIDYNYYISETQKIINLIQDQQLKLF